MAYVELAETGIDDAINAGVEAAWMKTEHSELVQKDEDLDERINSLLDAEGFRKMMGGEYLFAENADLPAVRALVEERAQEWLGDRIPARQEEMAADAVEALEKASPEEKEALLDILHDEGFGGAENEITNAEQARELAEEKWEWYRSVRKQS